MRMTARSRRIVRRLVLCALACTLAPACSTVDNVKQQEGAAAHSVHSAPSARSLESLKIDASTTKDVEQVWGPPYGTRKFQQGHQVWHYYQPKAGMAALSQLPTSHVGLTERGREAVEHVLLFDAQGVLRQAVERELPGPSSQTPTSRTPVHR